MVFYNETNVVDGENISHYNRVHLTGAHMSICYLKVDLNSILDDSTDYCYSDAESILAGLVAMLQAIAGTMLNLLVIVALLINTHLRKEYLTPAIISLSVTDLLFSVITLPALAHRYFSR